MIITKKHAELIRELKKKWSLGLSLDKVIDALSEEDLEYISHLELSGLVEDTEEGFGLSQAGHMISEAIEECEKLLGGFNDWPENFKFIGSEVISMIEVARLAQGDISDQASISQELEKRGLAKEGRLLPVAESILEAYDIANPKVVIGKALMDALRRCPPGPGKKSLLPFTKEEIYELEAMRLLTFSLPYGNSYSLTGAGQQIRAALLKGLSPGAVIDDDVLLSTLQEEKEKEVLEYLQAIGALDDKGEFLPAGKALKEAAYLLYIEPIEINPAISISEVDFNCLNIIKELNEEFKRDESRLPDKRNIQEVLTLKGVDKQTIQASLYELESYRLIETKYEQGNLIYILTEMGERVFSDRKAHQMDMVSSKAVMAITTTRMENLSPDDEWIELSEIQGLIGKGFPTSSGRLFASLASTIDRLPVVDAIQRKVLNVLPFWRGLFYEHIVKLLPDMEKDKLDLALDRLVGNELVDLLPGGLYKITQAGVAFKRAMSVVPEGIEFHVTPYILKILKTASQNMINNQIDWKQTEKECGLDKEIMNETVLQMRKLMYIKSDKITNAGKLLLEGLELLSRTSLKWAEIEV